MLVHCAFMATVDAASRAQRRAMWVGSKICQSLSRDIARHPACLASCCLLMRVPRLYQASLSFLEPW